VQAVKIEADIKPGEGNEVLTKQNRIRRPAIQRFIRKQEALVQDNSIVPKAEKLPPY